MKIHSYFVYIITNKHNGTLYTGVTNDLERRMFEHKNKLVPGFSEKYDLSRLIYYQQTSDIREAIAYEKKLKGWLRSKKIELINEFNPSWKDLASELDPSFHSG